MQNTTIRKLNSIATRFLILLFLVLGAFGPAEAEPGPELFPRFPSIEPNVEFWISIYSRYDTRQGVLHDSERLDVIYDIIQLEDADTVAGRRINRGRIRAAKKQYGAILRTLASGAAPDSARAERVAALFGPEAGPATYRAAARRIRCQVGQADRFRSGLIRSGAYLETIRQIFRTHGLPEDLIYLPHVESSFNPRAYSKFGAAGIWQFTRSTGRRYMQVDYTVDERRDPILASHAAARLLRDNYAKLHSWPLAITAYNHGAAGMQRARNAHGGYESIFQKYRSRTFKFASRNFYAEFLAAREVAVHHERYFGPLKFDPPLQRTQVRLKAYVPAAELIRHLNLTETTLRELNPALRDPVFEGLKYIPRGYRLQLPPGRADWQGALAALPADVFRESQLPSRFHTVRRGETAGQIARRYDVRLNELIAINGLGPRATIYVNQNLRLPVVGKPPAAKPELAAASTPPEEPVRAAPAPDQRAQSASSALETPEEPAGRVADASIQAMPGPAGERSAPAAGEASADRTASGTADVGEVAADETLAAALSESAESHAGGSRPETAEGFDGPSGGRIAAEKPPSSPPASALAEAGVDETGRGPTMQVSVELPPAEDLVTGHLAVIEVRPGKKGPVGIIQVEAEETLGHYAEWLNVRAWDIRKLNGYRYGRMIHLGQTLRIPLSQVDRQGFEQQRYEYHKEMVEDFFSAYRVENLETYSVQRGDSLWVLSRERFELPVWLIRRYNSAVDLNRLMPSDRLQIPVVEETT